MVSSQVPTFTYKQLLSTGQGWVIKGKPPGFPGGAVVKNPSATAGDTSSTPGPGRSHMPRSN